MSRNTLLRGVAGATLGLAVLGGTTTAFATQPATAPSSHDHGSHHKHEDKNKHDNKCRITKDGHGHWHVFWKDDHRTHHVKFTGRHAGEEAWRLFHEKCEHHHHGHGHM
jgi:hypothetical protein